MDTATGPLFDGRAEEDLKRGIEAIRKVVSDEGERLAAGALAGSIRKHGSGRAERSITSTNVSRNYQTGQYSMPVVVGTDETVVTSSLASYGPWLEGTGSRNMTTRFKGYHSFRIAAQELEARAEELADRAIEAFVGEMN